MSLLSSAESVALWKGANGEVEILRFHYEVAYVRMVGLAEHPAGPVIERALDSVFASAQMVHTFWDVRDLLSYHSEVRVLCTNVLLANRKKLAAVHTLSRSKIVAMGVSVANLALGGIIENHKTIASFELAVRQVLPNEQRAAR
jgi:hypothetical protein